MPSCVTTDYVARGVRPRWPPATPDLFLGLVMHVRQREHGTPGFCEPLDRMPKDHAVNEVVHRGAALGEGQVAPGGSGLGVLAGPAGQLVGDATAGDPDQPGRQRRLGRAQALVALPCRDKDLLGDLLGGVPVSQGPRGNADNEGPQPW